MPTFKKCVNIGKKIPQVGTDDIANHSVTCPKLGHDVWDEIASQIQVVDDRLSEIEQEISGGGSGSGGVEIIERIDEINGEIERIIKKVDENGESISSIKQSADEISLNVQNSMGDISRLKVRADGIEASVRDANNNITLLQQSAREIRALAEGADGKAAEAILNSNGLFTRVTALEESFDDVVTGGEVDLTSYMKKSEFETYKSQTATEISQTASRIDTITDNFGNYVSKSQFESKMTQTATDITAAVQASKTYFDENSRDFVSEDSVASIAMSSVAPDGSLNSSIKIKADQIDIDGTTSLHGTDGTGSTTINGSTIKSDGTTDDYVREAIIKYGSIDVKSGDEQEGKDLKDTHIDENGITINHTWNLYDINKGVEISVGSGSIPSNMPNKELDVVVNLWQDVKLEGNPDNTPERESIMLSPKDGIKITNHEYSNGDGIYTYETSINDNGIEVKNVAPRDTEGTSTTITPFAVKTSTIECGAVQTDSLSCPAIGTNTVKANEKIITSQLNVGNPNSSYGQDFVVTTDIIESVKRVNVNYDTTRVIGGTWTRNMYHNFQGNISATGAITQNSDMTMKDVQGDVVIDSKVIANAPLFVFTWKTRLKRDDAHHVGTSAQYWKNVLPTEVYGEDGDIAIDYAKISMASVISLAREVERLKAEIAELKK